jgi:hypothetical protein
MVMIDSPDTRSTADLLVGRAARFRFRGRNAVTRVGVRSSPRAGAGWAIEIGSENVRASGEERCRDNESRKRTMHWAPMPATMIAGPARASKIL